MTPIYLQGTGPVDQAIEISLGRLQFRFSNAAELRDALLASFADAAFANGPFIVLTLDDARPAWSWLTELINTRSDWRTCAGVALQNAAHEGGDLARAALADLMANYRSSVVLIEWTEPLARRWPDVRANTAATGWGGGSPTPRLADLAAEQRQYLSKSITAVNQVLLPGTKIATLTNAADLENLLRATAKSGKSQDDGGPWSWLATEVLLRSWVRDALNQVIPAIANGASSEEILAMLDWFSEGWDLWRFIDLFEAWRTSPPTWWNEAAKRKPTKWSRPIRPAMLANVKTLGDVALRTLTRARAQAATPATLNLAPRP